MNFERLMFNIDINIIPSDGLVPLGAKAFAGIMTTKLGLLTFTACYPNG